MSAGVLVLGMHRSGTSFVAGLAHRAGLAKLRATYLEADARNPKGFEEPAELMRRNQRVLTMLGGSWFAPPTFETRLAYESLPAAFVRDNRRVLEQALPDAPWTWKDPRLCVTADFWAPMLEPRWRLGAVIAYRHPVEVAASLASRNGLDTELGLALWESYVRHALRQAAGRPTLVVSYDDALADPDRTVGDVAALMEFLGVAGLPASATGEWVDRGARHHVAADASCAQVALYEALQGCDGVHRSFTPPALPAPDPAAVAAIDARRDAFAAEHRRRGRPRGSWRRWRRRVAQRVRGL